MPSGLLPNKAAIFLFLLLQTVPFLINSFPLSTKSRWIVDQASGKRVKLACANWPSHLQTMIAEGLEKKPASEIAGQIASAGFNCVRFTWSTFMFTRGDYGKLTVSQSLDKLGLKDAKAGVAKNNPRFLSMDVISVHKAVVEELGRHNLMVVLDNHISQPGWCCSGEDGNGFFGDWNFDPNEWLLGLTRVAQTYKGNRAVIAMSLRNELRGKRQNENDWYRYMQEGAKVVHRHNPDILVIVSGLHYDVHLEFLKWKPFGANIGDKLVFEAHWYTFGTSTEEWKHQTNKVCAKMLRDAEERYLFLLRGSNAFPVFMSEFGIDQTGHNEADNRYISCFLAAAAANDLDWALWSFQGSYMLREGRVNTGETYGIMDFDWNRQQNPAFVQKLQNAAVMNQDPSSGRFYYKIYHPESGKCVAVGKSGLFLYGCKEASHWEQHQDGGPIKLVNEPSCLKVAGNGNTITVSRDCSSYKWRVASVAGLQLAAQNADGSYLCMEKSATGVAVITKECLCLTPKLDDLPSCGNNPESQWFKFIPANV